jgi:hypothetical protein
MTSQPSRNLPKHAVSFRAKLGRSGHQLLLSVTESYAVGPVANMTRIYRLYPDDAVKLARQLAEAVQSIGNPEADYADD